MQNDSGMASFDIDFHDSLLPYEYLEATREARTRAAFESQKREWEGIRSALSKSLGTSPSRLVFTHSEGWREAIEEKELLERVTPVSEDCNRASLDWEM